MKETANEPKWTFITNHAVVLSRISHDPVITAGNLAEIIGITERAVRRIISELHREGYILKFKEGRRVRYAINHDSPLRHKALREKAVGDLLQILGSMESKPG